MPPATGFACVCTLLKAWPAPHRPGPVNRFPRGWYPCVATRRQPSAALGSFRHRKTICVCRRHVGRLASKAKSVREGPGVSWFQYPVPEGMAPCQPDMRPSRDTIENLSRGLSSWITEHEKHGREDEPWCSEGRTHPIGCTIGASQLRSLMGRPGTACRTPLGPGPSE